MPTLPSVGIPSADYIPGTVGDPAYKAPVANVWPPEGWAQHPGNTAYYYKGQEVMKEEDLRAKFAPPPVIVPPAVVPPAAALPPALPQVPAIPVAPSAPQWPPGGWQQHPGNPAYYYLGSEVLTEADLRSRMAPVVPATPQVPSPPVPVVPSMPAVPTAPPAPSMPAIPVAHPAGFQSTATEPAATQPAGPQSFAPQAASSSGLSESAIRAALGADAEEIMLLARRSGDTSGAGLNSAEIDRWLALWTRIGS